MYKYSQYGYKQLKIFYRECGEDYAMMYCYLQNNIFYSWLFTYNSLHDQGIHFKISGKKFTLPANYN